MIITNTLGLPDAFVKAASTGAYPPSLWRHRVSQLTGSVRMRWFELARWDELRSDASERLWAIMGTMLHNFIAEHCGDNEISEERLTYHHTIGERSVAISGQADLLTQIGSVPSAESSARSLRSLGVMITPRLPLISEQ